LAAIIKEIKVLQQVLRELEATQGLLNLSDLAQRLGVEQSALEGMIELLVRKGRLKDDQQEAEKLSGMCSSVTCAGSCPGPKDCRFVIKIPRTYSLVSRNNEGTEREEKDRVQASRSFTVISEEQGCPNCKKL
jgi:hypothetical protein